MLSAQRARNLLAVSGAIYVGIILALAVPYFQSHALYLNAAKFPLFADFNSPEKYGLAPNKTVNLRISTPDNETLGAWLILSDSFYHSRPVITAPTPEDITTALQDKPTILFLHGNAATRAFQVRVKLYGALTSRLGVNVLALDYRGYADSTGKPSESGLVTDARAAWDWLASHGAREQDIVIAGHSLGSAVAAQLGEQLTVDQRPCRGVALLSPFSTLRELLNTYQLLHFIPLMSGISMIPYSAQLVSKALVHKFDSLSAVQGIAYPIVLAHSEDDFTIPISHSRALFSALLEPHLPPLNLPANPLTTTPEEWEIYNARQVARQEKRQEILTHRTIGTIGKVSEFTKEGPTGTARKVTLLDWKIGGHDQILVQEGVQDVIGTNFGFL